MSTVKEEAHKLIDDLPDDATWDDLIYELYIQRKIERGLADAHEGRTFSLEEIKREFGIAP